MNRSLEFYEIWQENTLANSYTVYHKKSEV